MAINIQELLDTMQKKASFQDLKKNMTSPIILEEEPVKEFKSDFELDDDGEEYMSVGTNGLLAASEKLLAMNRGLVDQDERDSLRYLKVIRPAGMFRERIKMDSGKLSRQVMYQAARRRNLSGLLPSTFDGYIDAVIKGNPLTSPLEEINPMQLVENSRRITKMGPGGIPSSDSITEEALAVHPSLFGFIDIIAGPESERAGIDVRAAWGTKVGSNGRIYQKFYDRKKKKEVWLNAGDVSNLVMKIPD